MILPVMQTFPLLSVISEILTGLAWGETASELWLIDPNDTSGAGMTFPRLPMLSWGASRNFFV